MKDWIKIREFQFFKTGKFTLSNFRTILPREYDYMTRLLNIFETRFEDDPEFEQAFVSQSQSFDRTVLRSVRLTGKRKGSARLRKK